MATGRPTPAQTNSGDHIVVIYESSTQRFGFAAPFVKDGLAGNERSVYLTAESPPEEILAALTARGVRPERAGRRGAFMVLPAHEFFGPSPFDAARWLHRVIQAQTDAARAGFAGLRIVGDWAWTLP